MRFLIRYLLVLAVLSLVCSGTLARPPTWASGDETGAVRKSRLEVYEKPVRGPESYMPPRRKSAVRSERQKRASLQDLASDEEAVAPPADEEVTQAIGLNVSTGDQNNPARSTLGLEIDTWAGYLQKRGDIKVGPSLVLSRMDLGSGQQFKANLDIGDNFIGLSANYVLAPVICPAIGAGYGYQTDHSDWTVYGSVRFKIW